MRPVPEFIQHNRLMKLIRVRVAEVMRKISILNSL